jgi:hypothetical protein
MWCVWGIILMSFASILIIPLALIIAPIAIIAVIAYILV